MPKSKKSTCAHQAGKIKKVLVCMEQDLKHFKKTKGKKELDKIIKCIKKIHKMKKEIKK